MAFAAAQSPSRVHKIPQSNYIDAVRWLSPVSALDRFAAVAYYDTDANSPSIEIICVDPNPDGSSPTLTPHSSWTPPSRISSLKTSHSTPQPILAAATFSGSIHILAPDLINGETMESEATVSEPGFHSGPVSAVDLREGYTAVKWASPSEFATGGYGFGLQWWDQRRPGGPVSQFKGNWCQGKTSGIVHSIDIHPSRKHTCLAGGSSGTVFAWDLRAQQQPIVLSSAGTGEEPLELLAEPCAINSFDIDQQNPLDVICSLEWESITILTRNFNQSVLLECLKLLDMWHTEHDHDKAKTHTEHHHQGLGFEGGGEKNGRVVGIVGIGGIASFGRVGNVGILGSGGRAPGLGNDGCVVGMLGSGGRAPRLGNDGCVVGNVGCGRLGKDGSGGSTTPGNVGGIWRRRRAATPALMFDNDKAMIMAKTKQLVEAIV
ncbi:Transducin/WD40 repeat-like superfamily protein isoform 2 [Hibiscus syriacus]|uniref:Transducin/WD40 repeat-like superfamily protein isoform 2 n=1 Tax=Hibiscus syriacus TaxID=106335 RepID=A0A6A3A710_HIBSY|nr:Transducin/WD40 repeat-like superfamily protein isoform 2 [Hibiscus syriacus]